MAKVACNKDDRAIDAAFVRQEAVRAYGWFLAPFRLPFVIAHKVTSQLFQIHRHQ